MNHESPMPGQILAKVGFPEEGYGEPPEVVQDIEEANLVTSQVFGFGNKHKPVLDIDFPVKVLPSSTPGHFHLFIDKEMTWSQYGALLNALAGAGVIEGGYRRASLERGFSAVRLPWIKKGVKQ